MSVNDTKFVFDLSELSKLRRKLGTNYVAKVGIMGGDAAAQHAKPRTVYDTKTGKPSRVAGTNEGGLSNVELAIIHIFGSVSRGIPPRDFLNMPIVLKSKEIVQFLASKVIKDLIMKGEIIRVFTLLGIKGEQIVQRAFETGGFGQWPALKPQTIKRKGSSQPLIDTAQLRRAVSSEVGTQ